MLALPAQDGLGVGEMGAVVIERDWQRTVVEAAQLYGWKVKLDRNVRVQRKNGSCYFTTAIGGDGVGFPDLLMLKDDKQITTELKVGRNKLTPDQEEWIAAFANVRQTYSGVWYPKDWDEAEAILRGERWW